VNPQKNQPHDWHAAKDASLTTALFQRMAQVTREAGGWLPFDRFMAMALYEPGLGYYANGRLTFGHMPGGRVSAAGLQGDAAHAGSDFVTAPELSPLFGEVLARQVAQALAATGTREVWEFGAGTGTLAYQILKHISEYEKAPDSDLIQKYTIVDVSGVLRQRQRQTLAHWGERVQWADRLPDAMQGVVLGNEVLDAMPVKLLARRGGVWHERGVVLTSGEESDGTTSGRWVWHDRPTDLRPPVDIPGAHDLVTEIHPQAEAFMRTLAERLQRGAAFFIDYGFPEAEYYHPQRHTGTLACHHLHRMDDNPLAQVGEKDITAHVNFTGVALAAQDAGLDVRGYTTQGRFLINCGLAPLLDALPHDATGLATRAMAARLVNEHEMGELFKVLALVPPSAAGDGASAVVDWAPMGFAVGDRTHTL
jgi:SAM-dependent MidA family methyltransferase